MPGTTTLGIRYPLLNEVVNVSAWQNMTTDIETLLTQVDAKRDLARRPLFGDAYNAGTLSITQNVATDITYTNEMEDNGAIINLGVNNDRMTLGTGVWMVNGWVSLNTMTTITSVRLAITVNGTVHTAHKMSAVTHTQAAVSVLGCVPATAAGTILRLQVRWTGTGGPAGGQARLWALKLREL